MATRPALEYVKYKNHTERIQQDPEVRALGTRRHYEDKSKCVRKKFRRATWEPPGRASIKVARTYLYARWLFFNRVFQQERFNRFL